MLTELVDAMHLSYGTLRRLGRFTPRTLDNEQLVLSSGRTGVVFCLDGWQRPLALKCYQHMPPFVAEVVEYITHLASPLLPPMRLLDGELYVGSGYVDALCYEWVEGVPLSAALEGMCRCGDVEGLRRLAGLWERTALELLGGQWRHGDLKSDNIIYDRERGRLVLIDVEALYAPGLPWRGECGTEGFVHPARGCGYDDHIDDYGIALITVALRTLAEEPEMLFGGGAAQLLFVPDDAVAGRDENLRRAAEIFAHDEPLSALCSALGGADYKIENLKAILECIVNR